ERLVRAMVLAAPGRPLEPRELELPEPSPDQIRVRVLACAVCRTDLHLIDGELPDPKLPVVPGHQVVGTVERCGEGVTNVVEGQRVGLCWLGWACGACRYCATG